MELALPIFSQCDVRWASKKLGNSTTLTIKSDGCYLCCLAMCFTYWGHESTPDVLNEILKSKNCFDGANINTIAAGSVYGDVNLIERYQCVDIPCDLTKIDKQLSKKQPVIAWVDNVNHDNKPDHYIVIIDKTDNGDYLTIDPWTAEKYFFTAKWGDPTTKIYGLRIFEGTYKEQINYEDKIRELESKIISTQSALAEKLEECNKLLADLSQEERDNSDLSKQLIEARTERDKTVWEKQRLEIRIKPLEDKVDILQKEEIRLKVAYSELQKQSTEALNSWQLLLLAFKKIRR